MEINVNDENKIKIEQLEKDVKLNEYEKFYTKEQLKISLINVDSAYRNFEPKNIYSTNVTYLPNNPLSFTQNSGLINIKYPNHNFNKGNNIIIQNVQPISFTISGKMFLFQNNSYLFLQIPHTVSLDYLTLLNPLQIQIDVANGTNVEGTYFYGNIPLNSILGVFNIILPSVVNRTIEISSFILNFFNVNTVEELDSKVLLIQLPFSYFSSVNQSFEITDFYKITYLDIFGIPINGINADYPINYQKLQGFQEIYEVVDKNNFIIKTNYKCIHTGISGGSKIQMMLVNNTIEGYPNSNSYTMKLKKSFNNVARVELISTEFTFVDYIIKSSGPNKNNSIYWKQLDDGNTIYSASINEGNYDGTNLMTALTTAMNLIPRITSTPENPLFNNFSIKYNSYTQEIIFSGFKTDNLPNSLKADIINISETDYFRVTIKHPNNLVEVGDTITIANASDLGVISRLNINKSLIVYEVLKEISAYSVLIGPVNQITTSSELLTTLTDNGGGSVQITSATRISMIFTYPDTCGELLGFKKVGLPNSITPFKTQISNFDSYQNDSNLNSVGNVVLSSQLLNFSGNNNYLLLYINDWELITNTSNLNACFAKILLSGQPGDVLYNTYINYPLEFDFPISTLTELQIKITYPDGTLPDFRNINHSFTLRITEIVNYPRNTRLNSKNTTFLQTMKDNIASNT
jgi:hypothetical protein